MSENKTTQQNALTVIQHEIESPDHMNRIKRRLGEKAGTFITSLLDVCADDQNLMKCNPKAIVKEAMKAAALDLPISKQLGFAYLIPYNEKVNGTKVMTPHFQLGYKGYNQLAVRSGQYKHLNADAVFEGETVVVDKIRGTLEITGDATSDKAIGFFAYMKLTNGFEKAIFWTRKKVEDHARKYSKSFKKDTSPWKTDFDGMACKTMLLQLVPKYGPMTIEMTMALESDATDFRRFDDNVNSQISNGSGSGDVIDIDPEEKPPTDPPPQGKDPEPETDIVKGLKELQQMDNDVFQQAKKAAGVPITKPFDAISETEFKKINAEFNKLIDAKNNADTGRKPSFAS